MLIYTLFVITIFKKTPPSQNKSNNKQTQQTADEAKNKHTTTKQ